MLIKFRVTLITLVYVLSSMVRVSAQIQDSTSKNNPVKIDLQAQHLTNNYKLDYRQLIAPAVFIGFGVASLTNESLKELNSSTRYEIYEHQPDHIQLDNYTQYAPALLVYGLNATGIKGKHNLRDRTIIYLTSQMFNAAMVLPLKHIIHEERPDGSNNLSFPSGHTSTAFSSAQFMFREYKDSNIWLGISGYSFALFTGVYRTINNRHWVGDVVAGAGFGILSTELAYWSYPVINRLLTKKDTQIASMIMPYYQNKTIGLSFCRVF
ncbi:lipid A 1-phosphatase [Sphingobacterium mizutaii]|uniref:Lipid A 1-phosphatase n=2 Tax=Sphingobacterium mizutaii TaxID=1010 RepID=A0AAJ4XDB3_9SPHI|nr:phosphatase PAP2 family protein [Sphingobacterium mizutaii]SDL11791.1 PAP2 superfamily protein [Sphingobacterium mizutaii]SNV51654.1 lipid A 1-phosphatase [Sphingobacterium mizutaii]